MRTENFVCGLFTVDAARIIVIAIKSVQVDCPRLIVDGIRFLKVDLSQKVFH